MKTNQDVLHFQSVSPELNNDSTKLVSLLALAAGAIAMPQTSSADIIYMDLGAGVSVGYGSGTAEYQVGLQGTAVFKFVRRATTAQTLTGSLTINYRSVIAGDFGPATTPPVGVQQLAGFAVPKGFGASWDQGGGTMGLGIYVGTANDLLINGGKTPSTSYDHQYLAWQFGDSTQGDATRYGWIEIGLQVNNYPTGPLATIYRYGWDNTGAKPTMGQLSVPEPNAAAIVALGAMALGARGVRAWRHKRDTTRVS